MPEKKASVLAKAITSSRLVGGRDAVITNITNDSRVVQPGDLYAALPGEHVDGHAFIESAIRAGARGILCSRPPPNLPRDIALFQTKQPRFSLSEIADAFSDTPSDRLEVVGVTGTDGKSSTVYFIHQLLQASGSRSDFLSSVALSLGGEEETNELHQSTPEAPIVHQAMANMASSGSEFAVLESTSHGLSAKTCRLAHVRYRAAVLTNLTHEHLEFHGSYEQYRDEKANLFRALDSGRYSDSAHFQRAVESVQALPETTDVVPALGWLAPHDSPAARYGPGAELADQYWCEDFRAVEDSEGRFGVVNLESSDSAFFATVTERPVFGYGMVAHRGAVWATDVRPEATGTSFTMGTGGRTISARVSLPGVFNIENSLAAVLTVALLIDIDPLDLASVLKQLRPVRGRMNLLVSEPFAVIVDYAHTPGSFLRVLSYFREHTRGSLIVLFGSAGERDRGKRPLQGKVAGQLADLIILTDEDPRGESSLAILDQIAAGCPARRSDGGLQIIPDRREAIASALSQAQPGDTVLLLGKGHENSIIGPNGLIPWDEEAVAREELARLNV